jgi:hypothetical protein
MCSSIRSSSVPQSVVSITGVSSSAGGLLSLACAHSVVTILVSEIIADSALVPAVVWTMVGSVSCRCQGSLSMHLSSVHWVVKCGHDRIRCFGVCRGWSRQEHKREGYCAVGGWARQSRK